MNWQPETDWNPGILIEHTTTPSLRDHFAGQALSGLVTMGSIDAQYHQHIARLAYQIADAMIEQRNIIKNVKVSE